MVNASIFEALTEAERAEMFDWKGDERHNQALLRDGIPSRVGDTGRT
jgi:hypothetical protein